MFCTAALALVVPQAAPKPGHWEPIPLVTAEQRRAGLAGGEGGQWPRALAVSASDPSFCLFGTDVGGLFRSNDGGVTWSPCNVGYTPRGTAGLAIDPGNARRVLSVGANSSNGAHHGIYLSEDGAASWRPVLPADISGSHDGERDQIVFAPSSYDAGAGLTEVAYWSRIRDDRAMWGTPEVHPALYRSDDGGRTWAELPNSEPYGGCTLAVHPRDARTLYAGDEKGLSVSRDGGKSFRRTLDGEVTGLDVVPSAPNRVLALCGGLMCVSDDAGATWRKAEMPSLAKAGTRLRNLKVSPADPNRMVLWRQGDNYDWPRFVTEDGGRTWSEIRMDGEGQFLPRNARQGWFAWSAKDPKALLSVGGDWPTRSTDGGRTLRYSAQGDCGLLVGGRFAFNPHVPGLVLFTSQDYNGALTRDGGRTWTYVNPAKNGWGGFTYGGLAVTPERLALGNAGGWGSPRKLRTSGDGGASWTDDLAGLSGSDTVFADPANAKVAFVHDMRTGDAGLTWRPMTGCAGVVAGGRRALFGVTGSGDKASVVTSRDRGLTWSPVDGRPGGRDPRPRVGRGALDAIHGGGRRRSTG